MEIKTVFILIAVSVAFFYALPVLQPLALCLLTYLTASCALAWTHDGDILLMLYEKWGHDGSNLRSKVVWVTGASSGIGEALCYQLAGKGVKLILSSRREKELERVKERCLKESNLNDGDILVLPLDIREYETHSGCAEQALKHFQKVDILVNNAARSQRALTAETSLDVDKALLDLNVIGQLSITKAILPHMLSRKQGHIVNISSVAGRAPIELAATYSASKHALHGYFGAFAYENEDIHVTNVCPGPVKSNIVENAFGTTLSSSNFKSGAGVGERGSFFCMSAERCAALIVVAMANKLTEVWICKNIAMMLALMNHWSPLLTKWFKRTVYGNKRIQDFKKTQEKD